MKIRLKVPYPEKDWTKEKGARWDNEAKIWYEVNIKWVVSYE